MLGDGLLGDGIWIVLRCNCGGRVLRSGTEETERGPRWVFRCEGCGVRWRHRDGVFGPVDQDPTQQRAEEDLLRWFRRLPAGLQAEAVTHVQELARSGGDGRQ